MRPFHRCSLALAAAALLTVVGVASAQEKPSALLNGLEVPQLVARAEPGDHVRLSAHFTTLADRYAAEAKRHLSMSQSIVGNPNRNLGSGMSVHCTRLADLNTQSAATEPTEKELDALAAKAITPAEHRALEKYFVTLARRYTTEANDRVTLAQTYRGTPIAQATVHHDRLAGLARDAAKEATAAADMHKGLAAIGR
jgi:hypothetical protein